MVTALLTPISLEYVPSSQYKARLSMALDLFRHKLSSNSYNHHELHPWGPDVSVNSEEFDFLYAEANNQFMYHVWYNSKLVSYMATDLIAIEPLSKDVIKNLELVLSCTLQAGLDVALRTDHREKLKS